MPQPPAVMSAIVGTLFWLLEVVPRVAQMGDRTYGQSLRGWSPISGLLDSVVVSTSTDKAFSSS